MMFGHVALCSFWILFEYLSFELFHSCSSQVFDQIAKSWQSGIPLKYTVTVMLLVMANGKNNQHQWRRPRRWHNTEQWKPHMHNVTFCHFSSQKWIQFEYRKQRENNKVVHSTSQEEEGLMFISVCGLIQIGGGIKHHYCDGMSLLRLCKNNVMYSTV